MKKFGKFEYIEKTYWDVWYDGNRAGTITKTPKGYYYMPKGKSMSMMMPEYFDSFDSCRRSVEGDS